MAKKDFSVEMTSKIASLANIPLDKREVEYFTDQFNKTLEIVDELTQLDTTNVAATYNVTKLTNVFREDEINKRHVLSAESALSNAKNEYNGFFVVPQILNEK